MKFFQSLIQLSNCCDNRIEAFMKYRRELDIKHFARSSANQGNLFQLIAGMQAIKLDNSETEKCWQWERRQVKIFKISIKGLAFKTAVRFLL